MDSILVKSKSKYDLVEITDQVQSLVSKSGVKSGIVLIFVPHTTAGIICNENEANLKSDILKVAKAVDEHSDFFGGFDHDRDEGPPRPTRGRVEAGNAHAHIVAALSGSSRNFVIEGEELQLGTWQSIMLLEMDGPRQRQVWIQILNRIL